MMGSKRRRLNFSCFYRVIDANLNRSREGLKVCEDISRFILEDKRLTNELRNLRHGLTKIIESFGFSELLENRDIINDIGKALSIEKYKGNVQDVFLSNIQRSKESVRVLEELARIYDIAVSGKFRLIRFRIYNLEKLAYERIQVICHHR